MIAAPIPIDDLQRLDALHSLNVLDTPAEDRYNRIIRLLKLVMRVPMAYISLVDSDRQWYKAACGMPTRETPRSISFCGHAILSDEPLIVPDALEDERFRDNPMVTGDPFVRFYAGHPLNGPGGYKVGTLCIADRKPRVLRDHELAAMREMASLVERELGLVEVVRLQQELIASQRQISHELAQAAQYVQSLLPEPLDGAVKTRWRFEPSSQLGGDSFGYDWIDPDHLAIYLLDVSGHGVGAALMSVSAANALRARSLPDTNFRRPSEVLSRLNDAFPMDRHDGKYLTIWYGVYDRVNHTLTYATGGHPPALLLTGPNRDEARPIELGEGSFAIGMFPDVSFESETVALEPFSTLYVYSDGAYEIHKNDGSIMNRDELIDYLVESPEPRDPDDVLDFVRRENRDDALVDDFSFLEVSFDPLA